MKLEKIEDNLTLKKETRELIFKLGDKKVVAYYHYYYDSISNEYDSDFVLDENKDLTEEEREFIDENIGDLLLD